MNSFLGSMTKYGLIFFNFICLIFGLLCIIFGALARSSSNYENVVNIGRGPANMAIIIGVVVFFICFLGCCGAVKEHRCMLLTFGSVVLILVVIEFSVGGIAYKYRDQLEDISSEQLSNSIKTRYGNDTQFTKDIDDLQTSLKCCGADGPKDFMGKIPKSCCSDQQDCPKSAYDEGCVKAIKETLAPAMKALAVTVIIFGCIQLLGIFASCCVASCIKRTQYDHV